MRWTEQEFEDWAKKQKNAKPGQVIKTNDPRVLNAPKQDQLHNVLGRLELHIQGKPIPKKRPRFARRGKFVTTYDEQEKEKESFIAEVIPQLNGLSPLPSGTAVFMRIHFRMPIPKKGKKEGDWHTSRPDLDNLIKMVKDCLNKVTWNDDSQVVLIEATKKYHSKPETIINLEW